MHKGLVKKRKYFTGSDVNFLVEKQTIDEDGDDGLEHAELSSRYIFF
jgi:hypothetical protein